MLQVWSLTPLPSGGVSLEALSDLVRHNRAVNAVKFSPDGTLLASADDGESMRALYWPQLMMVSQ